MSAPISYRLSGDIAAPPADVWSVWSDVARWSEWTASVSRTEILSSPGAMRVGLRARVIQPKLPPGIWTVTAVDESADRRSFVWESRSPGAHVVGTHTVTSTPTGSHVEATLVFDGFVGRLVGRFTRALSLRYMQMEIDGLRARSLAGSAARH